MEIYYFTIKNETNGPVRFEERKIRKIAVTQISMSGMILVGQQLQHWRNGHLYQLPNDTNNRMLRTILVFFLVSFMLWEQDI
jgi:hypothetical protein